MSPRPCHPDHFHFAQCVVQSYLKWLEDSNYDPICVLCSKSIQEGEVVRLACYGEFYTTNTTFAMMYLLLLQMMKAFGGLKSLCA